MKFLLIGTGAREHAIAWKLSQSTVVDALFVLPGNPGMNNLPNTKLVDDVDVKSHSAVVQYCRDQSIDIVVVGPEGPLADGIADDLAANNIKCFGPKKEAALLESSKAFSKGVLESAGIPTASYDVARSKTECESFAKKRFAEDGGVVLKASGLAGGKGVFVCSESQQIDDALELLYENFSEAAETIVVEELMVGRESSYFCCLGSGEPVSLGFAVDFKRLEENDQGPNTGGMGCYTPVPWLPEGAKDEVHSKVVEPLLKELEKRGITYTGFLYVGLMWTNDGPKVVEFNVRLGDPEAQILAISSSLDWGQLISDKLGVNTSVGSRVDLVSAEATYAVGVVMASESYPYSSEANSCSIPVNLFDGNDSSQVFAASIKPSSEEDALATGAGRVLTSVGCGSSFHEARELAYRGVTNISKYWPHARWREDIAKRIIEEKVYE